MTGNAAAVVEEKPELILVRCFNKKYDVDDPESAIETPIPMWLFFDRANDEIFYRGTLRAFRNHLMFLVSREKISRSANVEYYYSTSNKVDKDTSPVGVVVPLEEILSWLQDVEDQIDVARQMYKEEFN